MRKHEGKVRWKGRIPKEEEVESKFKRLVGTSSGESNSKLGLRNLNFIL